MKTYQLYDRPNRNVASKEIDLAVSKASSILKEAIEKNSELGSTDTSSRESVLMEIQRRVYG